MQYSHSKIWQAGLYIRLSQDDKDNDIGNSIINQEKYLKRYAEKDTSLNICDVYIDNGYTGTNFNRPSFKRMIDDITAGIINCIIVKDLSRFGREHISVDNYLENVFPTKGVRFIAIMQNIDSIKNPGKMNSIEVPFLNLINEQYAIDISQKTRTALKAKQKAGLFVGSHVPYGYLRSADDKNRLSINADVSGNVKTIFSMFIDGYNFTEIADYLNGYGYLSPLEYKASIGERKRPKHLSDSYVLWSYSSVKTVLSCPLYTGDLVQGRTTSYSHKLKKRLLVNEDEWIVIKHTHEAIIRHETYLKARELLSFASKPKRSGQSKSILSGYLICADCNKPMVRTISSNNDVYYRKFVCSTSKKYGKATCPTHIVHEDVLIESILAAIQLHIKLFIEFSAFIENTQVSSMNSTIQSANSEKLERIVERKNDIENLLLSIEKDYANDMLKRDEYNDLKQHFKHELNTLNEKTIVVENSVKAPHLEKHRFNDAMREFTQHKNVLRLTRRLLHSLVKKVVVYQDKRIKIIFKFQDELERIKSKIATIQ